jgi:hypothetical protein
LAGFVRNLLNKRKYGEPVILVSGLPRSGTSMMMKMLTAGGLTIVTDEIRTADEDNPKGYFELERVKDLDKSDDKSWLDDCRGKVVKIISFLLKDLPDSHQYKVLFMRRNLEEVMASQNKMLVRRGEATDEAKDDKMIAAYKNHLRKIEFLMGERPNFDYIDINHRDVVENPVEQAQRVCDFLGSDMDVNEMAAAVDKNLYRNRR